MRLTGKTAIVTGAGGSIGSAIALSLAREGCAVGLTDIRPCTEVAAEIRRLGVVAIDHPFDIANERDIAEAIEAVARSLGGLDILVNAAGITSFGSASQLDKAEWDRVLGINLTGVFLACQAAIGPLRARGGGRIVNIGSILGKNGGNARPWLNPDEQKGSSNVAYGVSKAGVHAMTFYLARELAADRITVNCVAPGPIASPMTKTFPAALAAQIPAGRLGQPSEVAAAVLFLASDDAAFITGEVLDINGGMWAD